MISKIFYDIPRNSVATLSARILPVAGAGGQHFASASIFDSTVRRGRGARAARRTRTRFKHAPDSNARPIQTRARFKHRPDCVVYDNKSYKTVLLRDAEAANIAAPRPTTKPGKPPLPEGPVAKLLCGEPARI